MYTSSVLVPHFITEVLLCNLSNVYTGLLKKNVNFRWGEAYFLFCMILAPTPVRATVSLVIYKKKKSIPFSDIIIILIHSKFSVFLKLRLCSWEGKVMPLISKTKNEQIYISLIFNSILYIFTKSQILGATVLIYA